MDDLKKAIKKKYKNCRKEFWTMPQVVWVCIASFASVCFLVASYGLRHCSPWLSPLFQAVGVGILTGIIIYVLSNIRAKNQVYINKSILELMALENTIYKMINLFPNKVKRYLRYGIKYDYYIPFEDNNDIKMTDCINDLYKFSEEYIEGIRYLNEELLDDFIVENGKNYATWSGKMEVIKTQITNDISEKKAMDLGVEIVEVFLESFGWLLNKLHEFQIQDRQIRKYPL